MVGGIRNLRPENKLLCIDFQLYKARSHLKVNVAKVVRQLSHLAADDIFPDEVFGSKSNRQREV